MKKTTEREKKVSEKQVTALRFLLLFFNDGFYHFNFLPFGFCYFFLAKLKHFSRFGFTCQGN